MCSGQVVFGDETVFVARRCQSGCQANNAGDLKKCTEEQQTAMKEQVKEEEKRPPPAPKKAPAPRHHLRARAPSQPHPPISFESAAVQKEGPKATESAPEDSNNPKIGASTRASLQADELTATKTQTGCKVDPVVSTEKNTGMAVKKNCAIKQAAQSAEGFQDEENQAPVALRRSARIRAAKEAAANGCLASESRKASPLGKSNVCTRAQARKRAA